MSKPCQHTADTVSAQPADDSPGLYDVTCEHCGEGGAFSVVEIGLVARSRSQDLPDSLPQYVALANELSLVDW